MKLALWLDLFCPHTHLPGQIRAATQLLRRSSRNPASRVRTKTATNRHRCRVRRKRQRLPSCLLIENASARAPCLPPLLCAEAFPMKASDYPLGGNQRFPECRLGQSHPSDISSLLFPKLVTRVRVPSPAL